MSNISEIMNFEQYTFNELKNKNLKLLDSKNDIDTLEDLNSNETLKKML